MNDFLCNNRLRPEEVLCSRRQFLTRCGLGLGALGLANLLSEEVLAAAPAASGGIRPTHFPARGRHVIHIFAQGAPSHIDTWDPKPILANYEDQSLPGLNGVAMPSPFKFSKRGRRASKSAKSLTNWETTWMRWPSSGPCIPTFRRMMWPPFS